MAAEPRFEQKETIDQPGIIGARWWQESIATEVPRRKAITGILALGGALAGVAAIGLIASRVKSSSSSGSSGGFFSSTPSYEYQPKTSLDMQKEYGWNFGATGEALVFDGTSTQPFDRKSLETIAEDMAPATALYGHYWNPTLFQAPLAMPKSKPAGDPDAPAFLPLKDVIVPISTAAMTRALGQGKALAALLAANAKKTKDLALVVDLPGPLAVAFAAGLVNQFDPIFLFDNWPHPHGVVAAHLTLAAAMYYQPLFAKARQLNANTNSGTPKLRPMFVLDRARLATYVDDTTQFDNRYTAKMPSPADLRAMTTSNLLYIGPNAIDRFELDDLNDDFARWSTAGAVFHVCPANSFEPLGAGGDPLDSATYSATAPATPSSPFWMHWDQPANRLPAEVQKYAPSARTTSFSSGTTSATAPATHPRPAGFGTVPVVVAVGTGVVLGARASRSGSWNRTPYTSSGS